MRQATSFCATLVEDWVVVRFKFDLTLANMAVNSIPLRAPAVVPTPGTLRRFDFLAFLITFVPVPAR